jgi:hypothetical protein
VPEALDKGAEKIEAVIATTSLKDAAFAPVKATPAEPVSTA